MKEYDEILAWLLSDDDIDHNSTHENEDLPSYFQNAIHKNCFSRESFQSLLSPQPGSQTATRELDHQGSISQLHCSTKLPAGSSPDPQVLVWKSGEASSSNLGLVAADCVGMELNLPPKRMCGQHREATLDDVKAWRKHDRLRKQPIKDAVKHSMLERTRRNKIRQKIQALQTLIPTSNKLDAASVLGNAINYVKTMQLLIMTMLAESGSSSSSSINSLHEQSHQLGFPRPTICQRMCPVHNAISSIQPAPLLIPSSAMSRSSLSCTVPRTAMWVQRNCAPPNLLRPVTQFPHPSASGGFSPPCMFHHAGAWHWKANEHICYDRDSKMRRKNEDRKVIVEH